ncbi:MAG: amino acid permease [Spirochaetes bacterium]|nr:amino acid permease [Spirochaetota bacterium]
MTIKPKLGTFDLTMIVVSLVIGLGIFRTPVEVAQKAQVPLIFFMAWTAGAVASLCGALTFAEVGSRYPVAGGYYKIVSHCYHPAFAFMVNWITIIANAGSSAGVAVIGAEYINPLIFPGLEHDLGVRITTIGAIALLYGINMAGIKMSARTLNVLMVIKIGLVLLLIAAVFVAEPAAAAGPAPAVLSPGEGLRAFLLCFVPIFFTYGGYQQTINFGSDVPRAGRNVPRSIAFGIAIILTLYLLVNFSYYRVLGFQGLRGSTALASDMAGIVLGPRAHGVFAVIMFFSVMAYVNASLMSNPRIYYAIAEDGVLPGIFMRVNERTQVQEFALIFFVAVILIILFFLASFQSIIEYVMFFDSIGMAAAAASVFVLRRRARRDGEPEGIYRMRLYPLMPLLFIAVYGAVNLSVLLASPRTSLIGFLLFLAGLPLYLVLKRIVGGAGAVRP